MDQIIGAMVKLDENARKIVEKAENYKADNHQDLLKKKDTMEKQYKTMEHEELQKIRLESERQQGKKESAVKKETDDKIKRLKEFFQKNQTSFSEKIYDHCLAGDEE